MLNWSFSDDGSDLFVSKKRPFGSRRRGWCQDLRTLTPVTRLLLSVFSVSATRANGWLPTIGAMVVRLGVAVMQLVFFMKC